MKILLDTHIPLWHSVLDPRLTRKQTKLLEDSDSELYISVMSLWEIAILHEKKRITLSPDPHEWCRTMLIKLRVQPIDLTLPIIKASRELDFPHQDPVDRFIGATAFTQNMHLMTADERLSALPWLKCI